MGAGTSPKAPLSFGHAIQWCHHNILRTVTCLMIHTMAFLLPHFEAWFFTQPPAAWPTCLQIIWSSVPVIQIILLVQHLAIVNIDFQSLQHSINQELLFLRDFCWLFFFSFSLFFSPQTDLWERVPQHRNTLFGCQILIAVGRSQEACIPLPVKVFAFQ